jgi:Ca2+-transporting ATPase
MAAIVTGGCAAMVAGHWAGADVRTAAFLALVSGVFLLVPANRVGAHAHGLPRIRNRRLAVLVLGVAGMLALVLGLPWMRQVMGFAAPSAGMLGAVALLAAAMAAWLAALRGWRLRRADHQDRHG